MPIEFTANHGDYSVTTRSDQRWFTVYKGEEIAGTLQRPGVYDRNKRWRAFATNGDMIGSGIGPRTALALFTRRDIVNRSNASAGNWPQEGIIE